MHRLWSFPVLGFIIFCLAVVSFFLSAAETSIIGLSRIRLRHMISQGLKRAQSLQRIVGKLDKFIAAILIGNNFVSIMMSAIITAIFVRIAGYNWGVVIATIATTLFVLIFCEITPKMLAAKRTEKVALFAAPVMEAAMTVLDPLVRIFTAISEFLLMLIGLRGAKRAPLITQEELRMMIEVSKEEGVLTEQERKMLHRIFEFGATRVQDVMVPKDKIAGVSKMTAPEDLLNVFVEQGHARLPVYDGTIDKIVGVVYASDLLYILRDRGLFVLQDLIHEPYFASGRMRVQDLLKEFQTKKIQIAIVVDEYKTTMGVVTLEDLVEEIVGEIEERLPSRGASRGKKN